MDELFSRHYDVTPERLLAAVQQVIAVMPNATSQRLDEGGGGVSFRTTLNLTSWGQQMRAVVQPADGGGAVLRVSGQPRVGIMSTPWGEEVHAAQVERQLFAALDTALAVERAQDAVAEAATPGSSRKAREIMTTEVEVISPDATIEDAAVLLAAADIGALPICNWERRLQGMLTDRDIVVRAIAQGRDPKSTHVRDVIEGIEVVTIGADDTLDEAMRTMQAHNVRRLPVIDGHELVGMISQGDLAQHLPEAAVGALVESISAAPDA